MRRIKRILIAGSVLLLAACSPKIYGTVQLVDANLQPIPATQDTPEGTVVNMINTTGDIGQSSHAVTVNAEGKFESQKEKVTRGMYKVEASRIGYSTETQDVEIKKFTRKKVEFKLKKILEGKRETIKGAKSDEDKIINPGEVSIQPPSM